MPRAPAAVDSRREVTTWFQATSGIDPLSGCRIPEAVLAERSSTESKGGPAPGASALIALRAAVRVWQPTVSPAQSRAAARYWPTRRDRDRQLPATPRGWWSRATAQAARRARRYIWPAAR